jgi:Cytochrome P450
MIASEEDRLDEEEIVAQITYAVMHSRIGDSDKQPIYPRTLVFAATDTTSNALSRILQLLALHSDTQDKLREELTEACGTNKELTHDQLVSLPYLEAVCRETLRL